MLQQHPTSVHTHHEQTGAIFHGKQIPLTSVHTRENKFYADSVMERDGTIQPTNTSFEQPTPINQATITTTRITQEGATTRFHAQHTLHTAHAISPLAAPAPTRSVSQPVASTVLPASSKQLHPSHSHHLQPHTTLPHSASAIAASSVAISAQPSSYHPSASSLFSSVGSIDVPSNAESRNNAALMLASASALSPPARSYPHAWTPTPSSSGSGRLTQSASHPSSAHSHLASYVPQTMPLPNRSLSSSLHHSNSLGSGSLSNPYANPHFSSMVGGSSLAHISIHHRVPLAPAIDEPPSPTLLAFASHSDPSIRKAGARLYDSMRSSDGTREREELCRRLHGDTRMRAERAREHKQHQSSLERLRLVSGQSQEDREARVSLRLLGAMYDPGRGVREGKRRTEALRRLNEERRKLEMDKAEHEAKLANAANTKQQRQGKTPANANPSQNQGSKHLRTSSSDAPIPGGQTALTPKRSAVIVTTTTTTTTTFHTGATASVHDAHGSHQPPHQHQQASPSNASGSTSSMSNSIHAGKQATSPHKASPIMRAKVFFSSLFGSSLSAHTTSTSTLAPTTSPNGTATNASDATLQQSNPVTVPSVTTQITTSTSIRPTIPAIHAPAHTPHAAPPSTGKHKIETLSLRAGASPRPGATVLTPTYPRTPSSALLAGRGMASPDLEFGLGLSRAVQHGGWSIAAVGIAQQQSQQQHHRQDPYHPYHVERSLQMSPPSRGVGNAAVVGAQAQAVATISAFAASSTVGPSSSCSRSHVPSAPPQSRATSSSSSFPPELVSPASLRKWRYFGHTVSGSHTHSSAPASNLTTPGPSGPATDKKHT